jgi:hypothetical protein
VPAAAVGCIHHYAIRTRLDESFDHLQSTEGNTGGEMGEEGQYQGGRKVGEQATGVPAAAIGRIHHYTIRTRVDESLDHLQRTKSNTGEEKVKRDNTWGRENEASMPRVYPPRQ